ncbi:MAG: hypothetical protein JJE10_02410 [Thermoleophilia bacterium]|nr:hypothetical protein [Thermoleophilia bacterium]
MLRKTFCGVLDDATVSNPTTRPSVVTAHPDGGALPRLTRPGRPHVTRTRHDLELAAGASTLAPRLGDTGAVPRLRQAVIAVGDLDRSVELLRSELGLEEPFADPAVGHFGLRNAVFAIGDTFLELVSPTQDGTAAGRLLERRGGDCGYMAMLQVEDAAAAPQGRHHVDRPPPHPAKETHAPGRARTNNPDSHRRKRLAGRPGKVGFVAGQIPQGDGAVGHPGPARAEHQ